MHLELDPGSDVRVEELERSPVEDEERLDAFLPTRPRRTTAKAQKPAEEGRVEAGVDDERTASEHSSQAFANDSRSREREAEAGDYPTCVSKGSAAPDGASLEDADLGPRARELVGAAQPDDATTDHDHPHGRYRIAA
jgi:hypothetical protein